MGRFQKGKDGEIPNDDPTAWMLTSPLAQFLMMHTIEIKYMCMFGYTFLHGHKLFSKMGNAATSFKFVSFIMACTGGGILVPIFINSVPVPLAEDAYPIAMLVSYLIHDNFPVVREVLHLSNLVKVLFVILYETLRAGVVMKMTTAAAVAIAPSTFSFPLFGPIMCGTISGCGGMFLPLNKGLEPLKKGLALPMVTAFIGATSFHLYLSTSLSDGCVDAKSKAHVYLALFFVSAGIIDALSLGVNKTKVE